MRLTDQHIEPIRKTRLVPLSPEVAFGLFTDRIRTWWPLATHSICEDASADVRFEGFVGGRVVEVTPTGDEHSWGDVIAWDPPHRFALAWHPSIDPQAASIVDVRFHADPTGCRVELEHRGWEELGADLGHATRQGYDGGWDVVLAPYEAAAQLATTAGK